MTVAFYYTIECSICGALVGHPCHNRDGVLRPPHEKRKKDWQKKEADRQVNKPRLPESR